MTALTKYLEEVEARVSKATPGPWRVSVHYERKSTQVVGPRDDLIGEFYHHPKYVDPNAVMVSNSRTDVEKLTRVVRELVGALKCNETFHRLGGIDDCKPCLALRRVEEIANENKGETKC